MNTRHPFHGQWLIALLPLVLAAASFGAMAQADPPTRVGSLSQLEGSVVLAPAGATEWSEAALNRPVTAGDRVWTDQAARAELHLGTTVLHLDDESFIEVEALDQDVFKGRLHEGTVNARVRELSGDGNVEIVTPQLAFRTVLPGDYRVEVDPGRGTTRIAVRSGAGVVYGADGAALQLLAGQHVAFGGRLLGQVAVPAAPLQHDFEGWVAQRNRREDQSVAARFLPREVVGAAQLDTAGSWAEHPTHGVVWYPDVAPSPEWAPYRYGRWDWIQPWGWTWIDDARWGFAPFHYGRWDLINSRWAWVPGRIGPRPVYAPALVGFVGGRGNSSLAVRSGPGIAWYPLAPGEPWHPAFRASAAYLRGANQSVGDTPADQRVRSHRQRPEAVTAVRIDDFTRGRPVGQHWQQPSARDLARAQAVVPPARALPQRSEERVTRRQPAPHSPAPLALSPPHVPAPLPQPTPQTLPQWPVGRGVPAWPQPAPATAFGGQRGEAEDPARQQQQDHAQREQSLRSQRLQPDQRRGPR